jgi:AMP-polyphosphate phosphotransferase
MALSLSKLLKRRQEKPDAGKNGLEKRLEKAQLEMLKIQQGLWHGKGRAVVVFEGFDAAGKGGAIRTLTESLDPRGFRVHPIGPPEPDEQGRHWLYRFWAALPRPGEIAIFDRSWYGRVLVERVESLAPKTRIDQAYREILDFERALADDGVSLIKIFLAISKDEQLRRFQARLDDPYKQWKLTEADIRARAHWGDYVEAVDDLLRLTHKTWSPWNLLPADYKHEARLEVLGICSRNLGHFGHWMEDKATRLGRRTLAMELKKLGKLEKDIR